MRAINGGRDTGFAVASVAVRPLGPYKVSMSVPEFGPAGSPSVRWRLPSVHPDGRKFVAIGALVTMLFFLIGWSFVYWPLLGLTLWIAAFFRDPVRAVPQGDALIVAPADGLVTMIRDVAPPRELSIVLPELLVTRISIYISVFDVHIQRSPVAGIVRTVVYISGTFLNVDLDKASEDNERQHILIERPDGVRIGFTMIAGLVARRIVPFIKGGDTLVTGQRVGLIRFGSRVDVYLPAGTAPKVALGQRTIAGETVLAVIGDGEMIHAIGQ